MMLRLAALGAISLLAQVVLLRELTVAFYGSELVILLGVALWLLGTGLGAGCGHWGKRARNGALAAGLPVFALLVPLLLVFARASRTLFGGVLGAYFDFPTQLSLMLAIMLPCALLSGWMFAQAARLATENEHTLATAYAAECVGGLLGGAAATGLLAWGVNNLVQALVCGMVAAATALWLPKGRLAAALSIVLLASGLVFSSQLDRGTTSWNHPDLLRTRDTPYGRVSIEERSGQLIVFVDDALAWENEGTAAEEFVQLAALQVPTLRRVLILGGGAAGLVREARRLGAKQLVYVEADRALLELLRKLPADLGLSPNEMGHAPRVVVADPRRYLHAAHNFDLILVGAPEPSSGKDNRFYTREFFRACARSLTPTGVVALRLPGGQNVWTPLRLDQIAGIERALAEEFSSVVVMPANSTVFMASCAPLPRTAAPLLPRLQARNPDNQLVTEGYLKYLYSNDRFTGLDKRLASANVAANSDRHPACYRRTVLLWIARFYPSLGWHELTPPAATDWLQSPWFWLAGFALLLCAWALRRHRVWRRPLAVAAAGAAGMMLEAALILDYQLRVGALYQDLGLLLCLFMLGMALGAAVAARNRDQKLPWAELALLPLAALLITVLLDTTGFPSLLAAGSAMAACAATVGVAFASLSRVSAPRELGQRSSVDATRVGVAPFLAADLIGSSLGCLLASLVLIPIWGPSGAAVAAVVLGLLVLLR